MKKLFTTISLLILTILVNATQYPFGKGTLTVKNVASNAVRIQYSEEEVPYKLPEYMYVNHRDVQAKLVSVDVDKERQIVTVKDKNRRVVFLATSHQLQKSMVGSFPTYNSSLSFTCPDVDDEYQFGLGQFQDDYVNIRGLSRRLTQVNTQISVPMLISNKGYGLLWNNYGLTEFNPGEHKVVLNKMDGTGVQEVVDVTSTGGGRQEVREQNKFTAEINVAESGRYALLLDVGQKMARRHQLCIDGETVIDMANLWLPPTASVIVDLSAGKHIVTAELTRDDKPVLYYGKVDNETTLSSPVAKSVDYTVIVGTPDEIIATSRVLTGEAPMMPKWALGYVHCRERFHNQDELLKTATRFRREQYPIDLIVQDWQYWGGTGWNSMQFDHSTYPDPKAMTDSLHNMNMRMMLSVWSNIDHNSEVGKAMDAAGYVIPGTPWTDFFNPDAAKAYWSQFSKRLLPTGIDAWWQDAVEPENDDLVGRMVAGGKYPGELFRNIYPLLVSKTVCEGLLTDQPDRRPLILTRCGFMGIQRYGSVMWSGDVGSDWKAFRYQIASGLGMQSTGLPWWTYDAGGFFRNGNQYTDAASIECMLRWIETSVYLPVMRVHGYQSNTEPWEYGAEAASVFRGCIEERYRLLPYIYSNAAAVAFNRTVIMRPLVFDFYNDRKALEQKYEYMFGKALLVSPVVEGGVGEWHTYLPVNDGGWYDFHTGRRYDGGQTVVTAVDKTKIPVFVRGGSIVPYGPVLQFAEQRSEEPLEIRIYPGADAEFSLYEDDGCSNEYKQGKYSRINFIWNDKRRKLIISKRTGSFNGMLDQRRFKITLVGGGSKTVVYKGKRALVYS